MNRVGRVKHALSCPKDGFMSIKHNEVRDFMAELLSECWKDTSTDTGLQQPTGETLPPSVIQSKEARVDAAAPGFWVKVQVFLTQSLNTAHRTNEQTYHRRVNTIDCVFRRYVT